MRCIAVINQKGGVGKTTTTVNIGAAFADAGNRVLLLDIDPQANLSLHLDRRPEGDTRTMTDLLVDDAPLREIICETSTEGLFMVPADTSLSGVETQLANRIGRETILRDAIEQAVNGDPKFDYVFLDCPPSLGVISANALVAADQVIIPMQAEYFSMQGMTKLMEVMELVRKSLNPTIEICLILPCMVDRRTNLTNEVLGEMRRHFGDVLADTCIRSNVKLAEAPSFGRTIFEHAPESNGARDYQIVADELLRRLAGTFEPATIEEPEEEVEAVELMVTGEAAAEPLAEPRREDIEAELADPTAGPDADGSAGETDPSVTDPSAIDPSATNSEEADPAATDVAASTAEEPIAAASGPDDTTDEPEPAGEVPTADSDMAEVSVAPKPEPEAPVETEVPPSFETATEPAAHTASEPTTGTVTETTLDTPAEVPPAFASATDVPILLPPPTTNAPAEEPEVEAPLQTPTSDVPVVAETGAESDVMPAAGPAVEPAPEAEAAAITPEVQDKLEGGQGA